jgi:hypothetical protein
MTGVSIFRSSRRCLPCYTAFLRGFVVNGSELHFAFEHVEWFEQKSVAPSPLTKATVWIDHTKIAFRRLHTTCTQAAGFANKHQPHKQLGCLRRTNGTPTSSGMEFELLYSSTQLNCITSAVYNWRSVLKLTA